MPLMPKQICQKLVSQAKPVSLSTFARLNIHFPTLLAILPHEYDTSLVQLSSASHPCRYAMPATEQRASRDPTRSLPTMSLVVGWVASF